MDTKQPSSSPLTKALFAFVLLLPGGFVAAPVLWFARKRIEERRAADLAGHAPA